MLNTTAELLRMAASSAERHDFLGAAQLSSQALARMAAMRVDVAGGSLEHTDNYLTQPHDGISHHYVWRVSVTTRVTEPPQIQMTKINARHT